MNHGRALTISMLSIIAMAAMSQKLPTAKENLNGMLSLRSKHGNTIRGNSDMFKKYIRSKHSKYSVVTMFTALGPRARCEVCPHVKKEFDILASSYLNTQADASKPVFFVIMDYADATEAFNVMNLKHVPAIYYFPGGRKRLKKDTFTGVKTGFSAMPMSRWLAEIDDIKIKITVPFDYTKLIMPSIILSILGCISYLRPDLLMLVVGNRILWGVTLMVSVLVMTSGQMWNYIRKPPEAGRDGNGMRYIQGGRGSQYIIESYIVMAVNMAVSVGFILLNEVKSVKQRNLRRVIGFIGLGMVVIFFGYLISLFRIKSRGYPYSFLFQ